MFLCHFSSTPLNVVLDMDTNEVRDWYNVAEKYHNHLNTPSDE